MGYIQIILIWIIPVLLAITIHEASHGYAAYKLGDKTAYMLGRVTLNPFKHIDLVGTVILPLAMVMLGGVVFGWAKPTPVNPRNLKNERRDMIIVELAGPLSNLLMAFFWGLIGKFGVGLLDNGIQLGKPMVAMGQAGIIINVFLGLLNLIPIPPLDGGKVVANILPPKLGYKFERIGIYGIFILLILIFSGALGAIILPIFKLIISSVYDLFDYPNYLRKY